MSERSMCPTAVAGMALTIGLAAIAWGGIGWCPDTTANDDSAPTKNCGGIVDTYGAIVSWTSAIGEHDIRTTAYLGASWNGSEPMMATEPANSPPKDNTSEHLWHRDGGTQYKHLTVRQTSTPGASGTCNQLNPGDPSWWFTPSCSATDQPPKLYYDDNGAWVEQGFDWYDRGNGSGSASVNVVYGPPATGTAQSGGVTGSFLAKKELPNTTSKAKILFKYSTVSSASADNAVVSSLKCYLHADCRSAVSNTP